MDIVINVIGQKLKIPTNHKSFVAGSQNFVRFVFNLSDEWKSLRPFAQFAQEGTGYNIYLDEEWSCYLPTEIVSGTCTLMLYGSGETVIGTTNALSLRIDENALIADAQSTEISQSLYDQLIAQVNTVSSRIDNLIDISGTGDDSAVEVVDIRTGYDGTVYDSAGAAVRALGNELSERIDDISTIDSVLSSSSENPVQNKVIADGIGDLYNGINQIKSKIDNEETTVIIPIPMEVGGLNTSGVKANSTIRARTVSTTMAFSPACPRYYFPEGTKHRFCYMTDASGFIEFSDWSTDTEETVKTTWYTGGNNRRFLRILVGYTDDRTITEDNLPEVYCKYTLNKAIPSAEDVAVSASSGAAYISAASTGVFSISPLIPVKYGKTYRCLECRNTCFYNSNLNMVSAIEGPNMPIDYTFTVDDDTIAYVMFTFHTALGQNYFTEVDDFICGRYEEDSLQYSLKGMKLSLLGDSISAYADSIPSGNDAYYTGSNQGVVCRSQMWWAVLCNQLGMTPLIIDGYSGSAVSQLEDSAHLSKVPMSSDERCSGLDDGTNTPDIILIAGGVNDYTYAMSAQSEPLAWDGKTAPVLENSFTEAYACMIKKLQTNYPNAIIVALSTFFTMRGDDNGYTLTHTVGNNTYTQRDYNEAIRTAAELMRIPYINVMDIGINRNNMYPTYAQDSSTIPTHPNAKGQKLIGDYLATQLPLYVNGYYKAISGTAV